jgi:hypothetical protein
MNRRVSVCVGLIVWSGLTASAAFAQSPPGLPPSLPAAGPAGIPVAVKSMTDASSFRPVIHQFIQDQLDKMSSEDPAVAKAARDKLITECTPESSGSYFDVYSQEVNTAVVAMLSKTPLPRLRVRLNLAVMIEAIAQIAKTTQVEGAVIKLINDPADVVALWGMKAAKPVIAAVLVQPAPNPKDPLILAILPAVKQHLKSGYVTAEAYSALVAGGTGPQAALILRPILDLLEYRVSLYKTGVPDSPEAETAITRFLSSPEVVNQHQEIVQTLVELISFAGTQAQTASKPDLEQIVKTLKYVAQVLEIIAGPAQPNLSPVMQMPSSLPGAQVYQRTQTVYGILKPVFPFLQQPVQVTPATPPSTTPAN